MNLVFRQTTPRLRRTESQRAMIVASLASLVVASPGRTARIQDVSQVDVARLLGVSRSSVQPATRVGAAGDAALGAMVMDHQLSVSTAAAIAMLPPVDDTDARQDVVGVSVCRTTTRRPS